jgi:hypothetical protein
LRISAFRALHETGARCSNCRYMHFQFDYYCEARSTMNRRVGTWPDFLCMKHDFHA